MFINNKYYRWYMNLIQCAKNRSILNNYSERHHIIPKAFGGTNKKNNIVRLFAKEHFIAHLLLAKCSTGINKMKMIRAAINMAKHRGITINSRIYQKLKEQFSKFQQERMSGSKNPMYGKTHTKEARNKISQSRIGRFGGKNNPMYGSKRKGKQNPFFGKTHSPETKKYLKNINIKYIWTFKTPSGEIVKTTSKHQFCKKHNLNRGTISSSGKTKGYILISKEPIGDRTCQIQ